MTVPSLDDHATALAFLEATARARGVPEGSAARTAAVVLVLHARHPYTIAGCARRLAYLDALLADNPQNADRSVPESRAERLARLAQERRDRLKERIA